MIEEFQYFNSYVHMFPDATHKLSIETSEECFKHYQCLLYALIVLFNTRGGTVKTPITHSC